MLRPIFAPGLRMLFCRSTGPVWVLPHPSGLNAHFKPADFARLYAEAAAY